MRLIVDEVRHDADSTNPIWHCDEVGSNNPMICVLSYLSQLCKAEVVIPI